MRSCCSSIRPRWRARKLNHAGLAEAAKGPADWSPSVSTFIWKAWALFLYFLTEKLSVKDRAAFIKSIGLTRREVEQWQKLEAKAKKLEKDLKSAKLQKPSHGLFRALESAGRSDRLFLLAHSSERLVHDRIKNYLQKISAQRAGSDRARRAWPPASSPVRRSSRRCAKS